MAGHGRRVEGEDVSGAGSGVGRASSPPGPKAGRGTALHLASSDSAHRAGQVMVLDAGGVLV